jgi:hypothetical protein
MFDAAGDFLEAVREASDALEEGARSVTNWHGASKAMDEAFKGTMATIGGLPPGTLPTAAKNAATRLPQLVDALPDVALVETGRDPRAARFEAAASEIRAAANELEGIDGMDELGRVLRQLVAAFERSTGAANELSDRATAGRLAIAHAENARPRLALMFSGRRRGEVVLDRADEILLLLHAVRDLVTDALSEKRQVSDDPRVAEKATALLNAANQFSADASRCVRRSWL